jgi:MFS transporter, putative metabolite:H+ symporter
MSTTDPTKVDTTDESGRNSKNAFVAAYLGWMFDYYEVFLLTFLLIPIAAEFGLDRLQAATLVSWQLLALPVGGVLFGVLADRYGRRPILIVTILAFSLATLARGFAPDYTTLIVLTVVAGIGIGGEYGVGQALVAETAPKHRRGLLSGLVFGGAFPAIMIAALVGGYLAPVIGWRWTFIVSGLPALLALFVRSTTRESGVWERQDPQRRSWAAAWTQLRTPEFLRPLVLCSAIASVYFVGYYGLATFLPSELVSRGLSYAQASWWVFFIGLGGLAGNLVGSFALDRLGRRRTLLFLMAVAVVGGVATALMFDALAGSLWILVPFFVLFFGANGPTVFGPLFSEVFPTATRSTGVSTALQVGRAFVFFVPFLVVSLAGGSGFITVVLVSAGLFLLVGIGGWLFPERAAADIRDADVDVDPVPAAPATQPPILDKEH